MTEVPKGVVAVFVGPDGREIASVCDFDQSGYGGYTMQEAQTHRIRDAVARAVAEQLCSSEFTKHIDGYQRQKVMQAMIDRGGYRLHIIPVGYGAEQADARG